MASITPFKAVRATKDKVALVSYKNTHTTAISLEQQFQAEHNRYLEFKEKNFLIQDQKPTLYIYKRISATNEYCGIIGGTSVKDYTNNIIKKHENTIEKREVLFKQYFQKTGFSAEPVLIAYPDNQTVSSIVEKYQKNQTEYEFTSPDNNTHLVWLIDDENDIKAIQSAFNSIDNLYIADGHHRCASSALLAEKEEENKAYNFILSYLVPESHLKISEFNRFVTDLNGLTKDEFLTKLNSTFRIKNYGQKYYHPTQKHEFSMYLEGEFYALHLRKSAYEFTNSLSKLDAEILNKTVLNSVLGITDIRNDNRIAYDADNKDRWSLKNKVDSGKYKVSFGMLPVNIEEMKQIANDGFKMPPKSTYIQPKVRNALTVYEF